MFVVTHAHCTIAASNQPAQKILLVHVTEKLCSKFGEDRSINDVTILSTVAGDWTSDIGDRTCHVILYSVQCCYALHWTDKKPR